jgi:hypothetical protein
VPKGKPWTKEETDLLLALRTEGVKVADIAAKMGKSEQAVIKKIDRLGLKVVYLRKQHETTTSELVIPKELPSIEEALKILAAAMNSLKKSGLSKTEILRLKTLVHTANLYKQFFADYVHYREIEIELMDLRGKYEKLAKTEDKNPRPATIATKSPSLRGNCCPHDILRQCCGVPHRTSETVAPWKTVKKIC